jgi:acetoin utilization protein AcuC
MVAAEPVPGSGRTLVVWDDALRGYDFGPTHPMSPVRLDLTMRLARELGVLDLPGLVVGPVPVPPDDSQVLTAHDAAYVAAVREASLDPSVARPERGLGTEDDPAFAGMHDASARVLAATVECARAVWAGEALHAVNVSGGLHHAMADRASGFCVYNDLVAGIRRLLADGVQRVVYVDVDAHHGDGVQAAFWDDPRVMTISLHESGRTLFPGTGDASDTGGPAAEGGAVNVALPAGTGDRAWLRALHAVVPPLVRAFRPDVLVTQHGCDCHALDPLAHLAVSVDAQRTAITALHDLAHEVCGGRWVATGGGGYEVVEVVPRVWTHLLAVAGGAPIPVETALPPRWTAHVEDELGRDAPAQMGDGGDVWFATWESGYDPADAVDQAIMATRRAVFPLHGLDAWFD